MTAAHPHALNHAHQLALAMGLALSTLVTCAPGSAQAQTSNLTFTGLVVGISDGDTINVLTDQTCEGVKDCRSGKRQHRVRLAEIDAPEVSQPHGASSRRMLSAMVFQKQVGVQQVDTDKYGRVVGQVFEKGRWINAEMVGQGGAWVYRPYARTLKLIELENQARASKLGLWGLQADQITPPLEMAPGQSQPQGPGLRATGGGLMHVGGPTQTPAGRHRHPGNCLGTVRHVPVAVPSLPGTPEVEHHEK